MKASLVIISALVLLPTLLPEVHAQESRHHVLVGFNPVLSVGSSHALGEFDLNIAPIAYIYRMSEKMDFRVSSVISLGVRKDHDLITFYGLEFAMPWYPVYRESEGFGAFLVYVAPVTQVSRSQDVGYSNLALWVEPGFQVALFEGTAFSLGAQLGASYYLFDGESPQLEPHLGLRFTWGIWW